MKKPANKSNKYSKDKFTATEVGTLVEQLRSEFHIFGEDLITVKERQERNTEKLDVIYEQVVKNTERITVLETAVREIIAKLDALIKSIDNLARTKIDRTEFQALEKRVTALEAKLAPSK